MHESQKNDIPKEIVLRLLFWFRQQINVVGQYPKDLHMVSPELGEPRIQGPTRKTINNFDRNGQFHIFLLFINIIKLFILIYDKQAMKVEDF
jgi:hypothetical protein